MRAFLVSALRPISVPAALCAALFVSPVQAQAQAQAKVQSPSASAPVSASTAVVLSNAWVRPAVKGQRVTGGYLQIKALEAVTLLAVASSVAGQSELHEMKMDGDVMRMRALPSLSIAAGQTVSLQPGGNHLMLMGLKQPIAAGAKVPLTLKFRNASGQVFERSVTADARSTAPSGGAASGARHDAAAHGHHGDHHDHHDHH